MAVTSTVLLRPDNGLRNRRERETQSLSICSSMRMNRLSGTLSTNETISKGSSHKFCKVKNRVKYKWVSVQPTPRFAKIN